MSTNRIIISGAGTGKTHKLTQTCVELLKDAANPIWIDQILIVTFTKAAAAELRERIARALNEAFAEAESPHLARQIALLERAQISTIHSFCLDLISRHFSEIGLSPRLKTLEPAQAAILGSEILDELFEDCFAERIEFGARVTGIILGWFRGNDADVRQIVRRLHEFSQALPDPKRWIEQQRAASEKSAPELWRQQLAGVLPRWIAKWRRAIEDQPEEKNAARAIVLDAFARLAKAPNDLGPLNTIAGLREQEASFWQRCKKKYFDPVSEMYDEAALFGSWAPVDGKDPLAEDWEETRPVLAALLELTSEFGKRFAAAKRAAGSVDFNDLEQFSLRLLWDAEGKPSARALECRERFKLIFVDEYQDTNPAQDRIIEAIASPAPAGNRFLVGDVKQSIYSFRHADPSLFERYEKEWANSTEGAREYLTSNWRSHELLLEFVNGLFENIMSREVGGVAYNDQARLKFAEHPGREKLARATDASPRVEVHYIPHESPIEASVDEANATLADFTRAEAEAEVIARRFREMVASEFQLPDGKKAGYGDLVILIRSPKSEVEAYAKVFSRHNIPFDARRSGYFESIEVLDLINLLTILDNPLQDRPLLGVLRSPIGCFSIEDLAALAGREHATLFASLRTLRTKGNPDTQQKAARFLDRFEGWRKLSQNASLAARLEEILEETSYEDWLLAQPRGAQRRANVRRFVEIALQFDAMRGEGLHPFLQFLKDQMENSETAPPSVEAKDAVRLVTVHNSKGLQYPIVALAGLGKKFNESDFDGAYLIDSEYGLTLRVRPRGLRRQYPSVPYHLARERQLKRMRDEEMRILYVALTRAQFNMILVARPASKKAHERWLEGNLTPDKASSLIDWIAPWLAAENADWLTTEAGACELFSWRHHINVNAPELAPAATVETNRAETAKLLTTLHARLEEIYPHKAATAQEAKSSVTALRRQRAEEPELARTFSFLKGAAPKGGLRANEAGAALHLFLERASLATLGSESSAGAERDRLVEAGALSEAQAGAIDVAAVASFLGSEIGREILGHAGEVRRELAFTAKFTADDLTSAGVSLQGKIPNDEFIVVQGAADLAVLLPTEIWLIDFKTDRISHSQLAGRVAEYAPQLMIYATALARIYKRPVTRACLHFFALDRTEWLIRPKKASAKEAKKAAAQLDLLSPDTFR